MEVIAGMLNLIGGVAFWVSFISVIRPLKRIGLPTRKRSAMVLLGSFLLFAITSPDVPDEPTAEAPDQTAQEPAPQPEAPVETAEAVTAPKEQATPPEQASELAARTTRPDLHRIDGDNVVGCRDRDYYSRLTRFAVQGDREAWSRALAEAALSGECTMFQADDPVFLADTAIFSGLVKIRREGELAEYWTASESVTR